jgi:flagellar protein FliT
MLILASTKQWGGLPALEEQYSRTVERLKVIEPLSTLDEAQSARKYQLLSRINANSAAILGMVSPQLAKLGAVMRSLEAQTKLQHAYGRCDDANL